MGWTKAGLEAAEQTWNLIKLGFLKPDAAKNPAAVKSAQTKYQKAMENPAFRRREELRQGGRAPTEVDAVDLGERTIIDPASLQGKTLVPVSGDRSATGKTLTSVGGVPLERPVDVQGGAQFPQQYKDAGIGWASMEGMAKKKQSNFDIAAVETGNDVVGVYSAMGPDSLNFSSPVAKAMYLQTKAYTIPKKAKQAFDKEFRKARPDWVGLDDERALDQLLGEGGFEKDGAGKFRSDFVAEMAKSRWRDQGFPSYGDVVDAIEEPALRDVPIGGSGFTMFEAKPGATTFRFDKHKSYDTAIPGDFIGGLDVSIPPEVMYPDIWADLSKRTNRAGEAFTEAQKTGSLVMNNKLYQVADQKWLDGIQEYLEAQDIDPRTIRNTLAGLAGVGLTAGAIEPSEAGPITVGGKRLIEAFHGSPHKFDKFSMDKIGTGEGAQAYGHGLYFADAEAVARGYREELSGIKNPSIVGDELFLNTGLGYEDAQEAGAMLYRGHHAKSVAEQFDVDEAVVQSVIDDASGALYRVNIDADPDLLLDYNAPLSEQSETVQSAVLQALPEIVPVKLGSGRYGLTRIQPDGSGRIIADIEADTADAALDQLTGEKVLDILTNDYQVAGAQNPKKMAAEDLRSLGIPGIRYYDAASQNLQPDIPDFDTWLGYYEGMDADALSRLDPDQAGQIRADYDDFVKEKTAEFEAGRTRNYVIFDDQLIDIKERGAATPEAMAAAAGMAAIGTFAQARQQKAGFWEQRKRELLDASVFAASNILEAIEKPMRGYHGLTAVAGDLAAGKSLQDALLRGGQVAGQPIEQTAQQLGDATFEATGSPVLATGVYTGANIADVF